MPSASASSFAADIARWFSRQMLAVRAAPAAQGVAEIVEQAPESLGLLASRRGDRRASSDMFSDLVQRGVQVAGGRPIKPQRDVSVHTATLLSCRDEGAPAPLT